MPNRPVTAVPLRRPLCRHTYRRPRGAVPRLRLPRPVCRRSRHLAVGHPQVGGLRPAAHPHADRWAVGMAVRRWQPGQRCRRHGWQAPLGGRHVSSRHVSRLWCTLMTARTLPTCHLPSRLGHLPLPLCSALQLRSWPSARMAAGWHPPPATAQWRSLSGSRPPQAGLAPPRRLRRPSAWWGASRRTPASCGPCTGPPTAACWPQPPGTARVSQGRGVLAVCGGCCAGAGPVRSLQWVGLFAARPYGGRALTSCLPACLPLCLPAPCCSQGVEAGRF